MINKIINYIKDNQFKIIYINNSVDIINFEKILEISDENVAILKESKIIIIRGNNLRLNKLLDNEILITGFINKIEL